ncbi:aminoglycoside resistance protein [Nocardioides guangzhouensis]|uniref:Aminoglycoside resistance protein n=2 Tax=Nocardioides guangzhouensis TaxID=2497878 RepID=A0A4V1XZF2_9ACTN|nr:aminoglycoside resistance protein [Nocardioides guangzhouensis]
MARRGPAWAGWVDRLPGIAATVLEEWDLALDGLPMHGFCALVLPVRTPGGRPAALKLTFDEDEESEHEHLALQHWHGNGAVRLLRADPHRRALLLERLHPEDLTDLWDVEACEVVGGLYGRLHVPAPPQLHRLTSYVERWAADLDDLPRNAPVPRRLVEQTRMLARDLVADRASNGVMIHGDLHYENVLAGDREPWLVIDPKPMSGDPHYEPAAMLWNRFEELAAPDRHEGVRDGLRRRFHTLVDVAGLDEDRARDWVVVRMVLNAMWAIQDAARERRGRAPVPASGLTESDRTWVTMCVTVAKAVQD